MPTPAAVIALDWGTSNLRAFRMDAGGTVTARRERPWGILSLPTAADGGGFDAALSGIAGDWIAADPSAILIASGMVGSAQGWREAPYVDCPAGADDLAARMVPVGTGSGRTLMIVPGILQNAPSELPDVIRGEETQVVGALATPVREPATARACYVLPGTHSKWILVRDDRIERFATYMTGELYAVLRQHSILGRLMPATGGATAVEAAGAAAVPDGADPVAAAAFLRGLSLARDSHPGDLLHHLFTVRSMRLADRLPATALPDYLSGLLIGHELVSATAALGDDGLRLPCVLVGEAALLARYRAGFAAFDRSVTSLDNTAAAGLFRLAARLTA